MQWVQLKHLQKSPTKVARKYILVGDCFFFNPFEKKAKFFYFGQEARVFSIGSGPKGRKFLPTKIVQPRDELLSFEKHYIGECVGYRTILGKSLVVSYSLSPFNFGVF